MSRSNLLRTGNSVTVIPLNILKQLFQDGSPKDSFERGMAFKAKCTIFSEGCRGHLGKGLMKHFKLNAGKHKRKE